MTAHQTSTPRDGRTDERDASTQASTDSGAGFSSRDDCISGGCLTGAKVPSRLARRFTELSATQVDALVACLRSNYFSRRIWGDVALTSEQWLATPEGRRDLDDHSRRRLRVFRTQVIPWLESARTLSGARILEIGCGTGASTVALAEQGANVTAIDIDEESLLVGE